MKYFFTTLGVGLVTILAVLAMVSYGPAVSRVAVNLYDAGYSHLTSLLGTHAATDESLATPQVQYSAQQEEDQIYSAESANPTGPVSAVAYLITNVTKGTVVAEHNSEKLVPIASLTKMVTAAVANKLIASDQRIMITPDIIAGYGNTSDFRVGETFRSADLMYPLLMVSSNEAAEAYARFYGRARFILAMNEFAQGIGAYRTRFEDPSGLSAHNVSTANDMVLILNWLRIHDPDIFAITTLKSKTVRSHTWVNPAHFLSWSNYLGGKNGYTTEANRTAAALFRLGSTRNLYAVVVLGSRERDGDVVKLLRMVK
jgi:D-alanyl-D-alanine carboxypeptidase